MYKKIFASGLLCVSLLPLIIGAIDAPVATTFYQTIAQENLKSFKVTEQLHNSLASLINDEKEFTDVLKEALQDQLKPIAQSKRERVFALLTEYEKTHPCAQEGVLDDHTWQDLEMVCGSKTNPAVYLAAAVDRTSTEVGRIQLYHKIIQPTATVSYLVKQQDMVRELINNPKLFEQLDHILKELGASENGFLSFWHPNDFFKGLVEQDVIRLPFQKKVAALKAITTFLNSFAPAIDLNYRLLMINKVVVTGSLAVGAALLPAWGVALLANHSSANDIEALAKTMGKDGSGALYTLPGMVSRGTELLFPNRISKAMTSIFAGMSSALGLYWTSNNFKDMNMVRYCVHTKLNHAARYITNLEKAITHIRANPELKKLLQGTTSSPLSFGAQQLVQQLRTTTFTGKPSFTSYIGRVLSSYTLMNDHKHEFISDMVMMGQLDAVMSVARLCKEFADKRVSYCFPHYLEPQDYASPHIVITNFWNPIINADIVVPNSCSIGGDQPRNMVITGPNAGGKTTNMRTIITAVILGQSLGVMPAVNCSFTPFTKIMTYLNITDDIAVGNSLFKAGVLRARQLIDASAALTAHQFALIAIDEPFNGTTYKEGQAATYSLIKLLGSNPQNVCITTTHFPLVAQLEAETGLFANYKVTVDQTRSKIVYHYQLHKGISDQIVTFKILQEEGFGDLFLAEAERIVA